MKFLINSFKSLVTTVVPLSARENMKCTLRDLIETTGFLTARKQDYYSPLPNDEELEKKSARWNKPSLMGGVSYDVDKLKANLKTLTDRYLGEFSSLPPFEQNKAAGFGPGYTELDGLVLYGMIRDLKPRRYIEVGSGLSTFYCHLATQRNAADGRATAITCVEPNPYPKLTTIPGIKVIAAEVQDIPLDTFRELESGDVLFIDSTHIIKIDGDVPYMFLEILPVLKPGVHIHVHDIPFPYNIPYPAELWTLRNGKKNFWPRYWNEAMLLQAFLAYNKEFEITQCCPILRYFDEAFLRQHVPFYRSIDKLPDTFSSIWLKRVG